MMSANPVFVIVMYSPRACMRWGSVHVVVSCPREVTLSSRRSRSLARAEQVRIVYQEVSGSTLQRGQDRSGFSSNQEE